MADEFDLKTMVGGDKKVKFRRLADEQMFYQTEDGFEFPVPLTETVGAVFLSEDKASLFMRWIRKEIAYKKELISEQNAALANPSNPA